MLLYWQRSLSTKDRIIKKRSSLSKQLKLGEVSWWFHLRFITSTATDVFEGELAPGRLKQAATYINNFAESVTVPTPITTHHDHHNR